MTNFLPPYARRWLSLLFWAALPALYLRLLAFLQGDLSGGNLIARTGFSVSLILLIVLILKQNIQAHWRLVIWPLALLLLLGLGAGMVTARTLWEVTAWVTLFCWFGIFLILELILTNGRQRWNAWAVRLLFALFSAGGPVIFAQLEGRFSEEEFFTSIQIAILAVFFLLLGHSARRLASGTAAPDVSFPIPNTGHRSAGWVIALISLLYAAGLWKTVQLYQDSFYPTEPPPPFAGVTAEEPFLCFGVEPDREIYYGDDIFERLVSRVEANPEKRAPEYAFLALSLDLSEYAQQFRHTLLEEARQGRFTGPANSVKSVQAEAAQRVYFYGAVREEFPQLFTEAEQDELAAWFAAINRRAQQTEWVDWLYALAFSKSPAGPYENQENGAGLLSLLEFYGLADPDLSAENQLYLQENPRGWQARFRNTDDAFVYQHEWVYNALYQAMFTGELDEGLQQRSFEWLLAQALPDGAPLSYNHPAQPSLAGTAYVGAVITRDPRLVWLAGRSLDFQEKMDRPLLSKTGAEKRIFIESQSPELGSCLLYGDSGLPNQTGPLAPDKIVLRSGWEADSLYLLLNLRFSGWHRYKASNTITLLYQSGKIIGDEISGQPFNWLPVGRSLYRDKRIPRENLNGVLIGRNGFSSALIRLTGSGTPWAQDPPYYSEVTEFSTQRGREIAKVRLSGWRGWDQERTVIFDHAGVVIVLDTVRLAERFASKAAAVAWQIPNQSPATSNFIWLRQGESPVQLRILDLDKQAMPAEYHLLDNGELGHQTALVKTQAEGLNLASIFLIGKWSLAEMHVSGEAGARILVLETVTERLEIPLEGELARAP